MKGVTSAVILLATAFFVSGGAAYPCTSGTSCAKCKWFQTLESCDEVEENGACSCWIVAGQGCTESIERCTYTGNKGSEPPPECPTSPVVLNLESGSFRFTGIENPVDFDIDCDGSPDIISWTDPSFQGGFLVLDRNGNGQYDASLPRVAGEVVFGNPPAECGTTPTDTRTATDIAGLLTALGLDPAQMQWLDLDSVVNGGGCLRAFSPGFELLDASAPSAQEDIKQTGVDFRNDDLFDGPRRH